MKREQPPCEVQIESVPIASGLSCLSDPPRSGEDNMRIDLEWLQAAEGSDARFTVVRFYQWKTPTVSLGMHQRTERAFCREYCLGKGIPVVRRPTGGRAVWHAHELTYAVVSNDPALFPDQSISGTYHLIARCLQAGLRRIGLETETSPGVRAKEKGSAFRGLPCFSSPSRHELICKGRKLVGSAQRRLKRSFLQHGSLPITVDYPEMGRVLGCHPDLLLRTMISIEEALGCSPDFEVLTTALRRGFAEVFGQEQA